MTRAFPRLHDGRGPTHRAENTLDPLSLSLAIAGALAAGLATGAGESTGAALPAPLRPVRERFAGRPGLPESEARLPTALDEEFTRGPGFRQECQNLWNQAVGDGSSPPSTDTPRTWCRSATSTAA